MGFNSGFKGLNRRLGGLQRPSGPFGEEEIFLLLSRYKPRIVQPFAYLLWGYSTSILICYFVITVVRTVVPHLSGDLIPSASLLPVLRLYNAVLSSVTCLHRF